jgi:hypothetical protein
MLISFTSFSSYWARKSKEEHGPDALI